MSQPDWYPDWRHDAFNDLQEKNARLRTTYRLGDWPRYNYDFDAGTVTFSAGGAPKVIAEIQIAGSTSASAGNWLWAWGNSNLPPPLVTDSHRVRAFGEEHGIDELFQDYVDGEDLNGMGWALTAAAVKVTEALGAYRPPRDDGGALYLLYKTIAWAS